MIRTLAALLCLAAAPVAIAQAVQQQITFKFDRPIPGVAVPHYTLEMHTDGTGLYRAETAGAAPQTIEQPIVFSPATVKSAFEAIQQLRASGEPCAWTKKRVADTGTKTLSYRDASGDGGCTYNASENKAVLKLTAMFQAIEFTLEEGRALELKHRFDRLGLDAAISGLVAGVENGSALELGNIAPTLRSIAADTELIQRVRLSAARLLERAKSENTTGS